MPALSIRSTSGTANDSLMVLKFWLIADGIFIWEFVTNLYYEWSFIRGRQPYRWAIWVYFLSRWATLGVVILDLVSFNITSEINCQAWAYSIWLFGVLGLGSGSMLIMLRIFAIWNMQKLVVGFSIAVWVTNIILMLVSAAQIKTAWVPLQKACVVTNIQNCKTSLIVLLAADVILLLIMLVGLLRLRRRGGGTLELGRLLWKQGCVWTAIATAAELPQVVLVIMDVNDVIKMMFVVPAMITMTVAATRMYRSLTNFGSPPNTALDSENARRYASASDSKQSSSAVHKLSKQLPMEVTVHTAFEEHQLSQYDVYPCSDGQMSDKPEKLSVDSKIESHEEKIRREVMDIGNSMNV